MTQNDWLRDLRPTPPADCGLVLALPSSIEAIERALQGGPYSDYVGRAASIGNAEAIWNRGFRAVADAVNRFAGGAARHGVFVREQATLDDLALVFSSKTVVTVVAHWRGPQISKADLLLEPSVIIERLRQDEADLPSLFREGASPNWFEWLKSSDNETVRRSRLAELLNTRLSQRPVLAPPAPGTKWCVDAITLRHENRSALERWWPSAFAPGNRLELADGLHSVDTIASVVPDQWAGIADLSNCQSAQLIDSIKRTREGETREDRIVIANELETNPIRRLALLKETYNILSTGNANYAAVRIEFARLLTQ